MFRREIQMKLVKPQKQKDLPTVDQKDTDIEGAVALTCYTIDKVVTKVIVGACAYVTLDIVRRVVVKKLTD